jgi:hypothetical protein
MKSWEQKTYLQNIFVDSFVKEGVSDVGHDILDHRAVKVGCRSHDSLVTMKISSLIFCFWREQENKIVDAAVSSQQMSDVFIICENFNFVLWELSYKYIKFS